MKSPRGFGAGLQIALGLWLTLRFNVMCAIKQSVTFDWRVSLKISAALDEVSVSGREPPQLDTLLAYGNQNGYYESDYPVKNVSDVVNLSSVISQRLPASAKLLISFRNVADFESDDSRSQTKRTKTVKIPANIQGLVLSEFTGDDCDDNRHMNVKPATIRQIKLACHPVKVGIGVTTDEIGCKHLSPLIQVADFVIVSIRFQTRFKFPESYGLFSAAMDSYAKNANVFASKSTSRANIFYLLKLDPLFQNSTKFSKDYISLLEGFASKWAAANEASVILDLPDYNRLSKDGGSKAVRTDTSGPSAFVITSWHHSTTANALRNSYPFAFNTISSAFRSLHLKDIHVESMTRNWRNSTRHNRLLPTKLTHPLDIIVEIYNETETSFRNMVNQATPLIQRIKELKADNVNMKVVEFVVNWDVSNKGKFSQDITTPEIVKLVGDDVGVGCLTWNDIFRSDEDELVSNTKKQCGPLFESASHFTWYTDHSLDSYFSFESYMEKMQPALGRLLQARNELLKMKPNATLVLKLSQENPNFWKSIHDARDRITRNFYCIEEVYRINMFFEAVLNWGRIHNFPILWKEAFESHTGFGWWSKIEPGSEISDEIALVPHFVMRNHPKTIVNWKTDPCVVWSSEIPHEGIKFSNKYAGAVLDMTIKQKSLTVKEVQTMLVLSLKKFSSLEVLVDHKEPLSAGQHEQILRDALSANLDELLETNGIRKGMLHVQVSIPTGRFSSSGIADEVQKLGEIAGKSNNHFSLEGIHVTNWERLSQKDLTQLVKIGGTHGVKMGLSVKNCSSLLNSLPSSPDLLTLLSSVNYILCESKPRAADNERMEFARYMDSQLYLSSAFSSQFHLNLSVHFRLNSYPCCEHDSEEANTASMLRFLNDANQFAAGNEIKYFLVQAFSSSSNSDNSVSWWRIEDYADLANASVYVDNEAKYRNVATWIPKLVFRASSSSLNAPESPWTWMYYTMGTFGFLVLLLLVVTSVLYVRLRKKSRLLSEYEVQEFLNGSPTMRFLPSQNRVVSKENDYTNMKFDNKYSLPKEDFKFADECDLLGSGNFGRVVRAVLGSSEVAVKIPHDGCTKESFKSMLTEVKVMTYVGSHQNVVTFLGCYVREISDGIIYIATELCANGCLLEYLRKHPPSMAYNANKAFQQELTRFSLEIASGMEFIGSKHVVHGDLSARNVLLTADNRCKITDFGLSRKLYQYNKYVKKNQEPLPWQWMAYESLTRMEFTTMSDVWSYGITLWEIFSLGDTPYPGRSWTIDFGTEIRGGLRLTKPEHSNEEMYSKMFECWNLDSKSRPTFTSLREFMEGVMELLGSQ